MSASTVSPALILYSRIGCSLCEAMQIELHQEGYLESVDTNGVRLIEQRDVDESSEWQKAYGDLVPLLLSSENEEICRYFYDPQRLKSYLNRA